MREAIITNGVVENIIEGHLDGSIPCNDSVAIGWQYDGANFTAPAPTLGEAIAAKNAELESAYNATCDADVTYNGVIFQCDEKAKAAIIKLNALRNAGGTLPQGFTWRAKDNSNVPFTFADVDALALLIGANELAATANLHAKKDAVILATTVAEVEAIVWQ